MPVNPLEVLKSFISHNILHILSLIIPQLKLLYGVLNFILFTSEQPNTVVNGDSVVMIDEGDSVTLNCTADGFPRPSII